MAAMLQMKKIEIDVLEQAAAAAWDVDGSTRLPSARMLEGAKRGSEAVDGRMSHVGAEE